MSLVGGFIPQNFNHISNPTGAIYPPYYGHPAAQPNPQLYPGWGYHHIPPQTPGTYNTPHHNHGTMASPIYCTTPEIPMDYTPSNMDMSGGIMMNSASAMMDYHHHHVHHHHAHGDYIEVMDASGRIVKRRSSANKKERRRTMSINNAFAELRDCIPNVPPDTKLSKIRTLRLATQYIETLMNLLHEDYPSSSTSTSPASTSPCSSISSPASSTSPHTSLAEDPELSTTSLISSQTKMDPIQLSNIQNQKPLQCMTAVQQNQQKLLQSNPNLQFQQQQSLQMLRQQQQMQKSHLNDFLMSDYTNLKLNNIININNNTIKEMDSNIVEPSIINPAKVS